MRLHYQGDHVFHPPDHLLRVVFHATNGRAEGFVIDEGRWEVTPVRRKP